MNKLTSLVTLAIVSLTACTSGPAAFDQASVSNDLSFAAYDAIYIAPVIVDRDLEKRLSTRFIEPTSLFDREGKCALTKVELSSLVDDFHDLLVSEVGKSSRISTVASGDNILAVSAILTDFDPCSSSAASASFVLTDNGDVLATLRDSYHAPTNLSYRSDQTGDPFFTREPATFRGQNIHAAFRKWSRNLALTISDS